MEIDQFLERDVINFLDMHMEKKERTVVDREEEYGLYLTKDYLKELTTALDNDELTRAKKLFDELKSIYNRLPKNSLEKKKVYTMLEQMYAKIEAYVDMKEGGANGQSGASGIILKKTVIKAGEKPKRADVLEQDTTGLSKEMNAISDKVSHVEMDISAIKSSLASGKGEGAKEGAKEAKETEEASPEGLDFSKKAGAEKALPALPIEQGLTSQSVVKDKLASRQSEKEKAEKAEKSERMEKEKADRERRGAAVEKARLEAEEVEKDRIAKANDERLERLERLRRLQEERLPGEDAGQGHGSAAGQKHKKINVYKIAHDSKDHAHHGHEGYASKQLMKEMKELSAIRRSMSKGTGLEEPTAGKVSFEETGVPVSLGMPIASASKAESRVADLSDDMKNLMTHKKLEELYEQGLYRMFQDDYVGASKIFEKIIEIKPKNKAAKIRLQECREVMDNA